MAQSKNPAPENIMPEGWRPTEGDILEGTVSEVSAGWSDYSNSSYPIVTVKQEDGTEKNAHCFHYVLFNAIKSKRPRVGERIRIIYVGQKKTNDGKRNVSIYKVETPDRPQDATSTYDDIFGPTPPSTSSGGRSGNVSPDIPIDTEDLPTVNESPDDIPF